MDTAQIEAEVAPYADPEGEHLLPTPARCLVIGQILPVTAGTPPLALGALTTSLPSPQAPNTAITLSTTASGGTTPYSYLWRVQSGGVWTTLLDWSPSATTTARS